MRHGHILQSINLFDILYKIKVPLTNFSRLLSPMLISKLSHMLSAVSNKLDHL